MNEELWKHAKISRDAKLLKGEKQKMKNAKQETQKSLKWFDAHVCEPTRFYILTCPFNILYY